MEDSQEEYNGGQHRLKQFLHLNSVVIVLAKEEDFQSTSARLNESILNKYQQQ